MTAPYGSLSPIRSGNVFTSRTIALTAQPTAQPWSPSAKATTQMQRYNELIERLVCYLMQEGYNFMEAKDEVLTIGRLDPHTTVRDFDQLDPMTDREALLGFKAYNAIVRLQRRYAELINKYVQG
ncbi:MAG: hypothetical protein OHK0047_06910 [Leptolyngbyaceae cyanobacterium]